MLAQNDENYSSVFKEVRLSAETHFNLHLYAAVYWIINHLRRLGDGAGLGARGGNTPGGAALL